MNFRKYDNPPSGQTTNSTTIINNYGGGGSTIEVDLTDVYNKINTNAQGIANNSNRITALEQQQGSASNQFLHKGGDSDTGSYSLGEVITDSIKSSALGKQGIGYKIEGTPENGYTFQMQQLTENSIPFARVDSLGYVVNYKGTTTATMQADDQFTLNNSVDGATVKFATGYEASPSNQFTLREEHCWVRRVNVDTGEDSEDESLPPIHPAPAQGYVEISETIYYRPVDDSSHIYDKLDADAALAVGDVVTATTAQADVVEGLWIELERDADGLWIVPLLANGEDTAYSIRYKATFSHNRDNITDSYRVFIVGTDSANGTTWSSGGSAKRVTITPSAVAVMDGVNGYMLRSDGLYKITSQGETKLL